MSGISKKLLRAVTIRLSSFVLLLAASGCGGVIAPNPIPVTGKVTYNGRPVTKGIVTFIPEDDTLCEPVSTELGEEGTFRIDETSPRKGVLPGVYHITITSDDAGETKKKSPFPFRFTEFKYTEFIETISAPSELNLNMKD